MARAELDASNWRRVWDAEIAGLPFHRESPFWLATGFLLPVWDRLPEENMRGGAADVGRWSQPHRARARRRAGELRPRRLRAWCFIRLPPSPFINRAGCRLTEPAAAVEATFQHRSDSAWNQRIPTTRQIQADESVARNQHCASEKRNHACASTRARSSHILLTLHPVDRFDFASHATRPDLRPEITRAA